MLCELSPPVQGRGKEGGESSADLFISCVRFVLRRVQGRQAWRRSAAFKKQRAFNIESSPESFIRACFQKTRERMSELRRPIEVLLK